MESVHPDAQPNQPGLAAAPLTAASYRPELDSLRALAIFSVMCLHWTPATSFFNRLQGQVSNGVHLFFVLSGFLITRILVQCRANVDNNKATRRFSIRQFYARRVLRIFGVYYLVLIVAAVLNFQGVRAGFFWHASYLSNVYYYRTHLPNPFDGPAFLFWSLAVEEQFYLVWPFVILFLPSRAIVPVVAAVAVAGTAFRVESLWYDTAFRYMTPACMNFLAIGSLVALSESGEVGSAAFRRRLLQMFGVLIATLACCSLGLAIKLGGHEAMQSTAMKVINQPMMSLAYACLIAWAACGTTGAAESVLRFKPLVYLGRISYGLYLFHLFVSYGLLRCQHRLATHLGEHRADALVRNFAVRFGVTIAIASLSWFAFEKPLNDLKRYLPLPKTIRAVGAGHRFADRALPVVVTLVNLRRGLQTTIEPFLQSNLTAVL